MTILLIVFCTVTLGHANVGVIQDSKSSANRESHIDYNHSATNKSIHQSSESGKIDPSRQHSNEGNFKEFEKITTDSAFPAVQDISPTLPTLSYRTSKRWHSQDGNDDTFEKGIPVPSLLEQLMKKVPRSGNDEGRKKEEIVLRLDKDYVPTQIADYVYRTGDERGISQLFGDMIHDGQASRDDVVSFLEHVQRKLKKLRRNQAITQISYPTP